MPFHRVVCLCAALILSAAVSSSGQSKLEEQAPEKLKLNKAEMSQFKALSGLVDAVDAGKEPAPADVKVTVQNHFIKSATNVFVPYVLEITGDKFTSFPVALYVRAAAKGNPARGGGAGLLGHILRQRQQLRQRRRRGAAERALELPPGDFDVTFALSGGAATQRQDAAEARRAQALVDGSRLFRRN